MPDENKTALFSRRGEERGDLRMIERAIRKGWELDERLFEFMPKEAAKIALSKTLGPREKIAAMRVILEMHRQNQNDRPKEHNVNVTVTTDPRSKILEIMDQIEERDVIDVETNDTVSDEG